MPIFAVMRLWRHSDNLGRGLWGHRYLLHSGVVWAIH
jgi:hypothetical protein